ncbi:MAG: YkgJ family cysteine cluster protein, partial [Candidatus Hodarchaeales archaeon]
MTAISLEEKRFKCQQSGHCCRDREIVVTLTYHDIFRLFSALNNNFQLLIQKITFFKMDKKVQKKVLKQLVLSPIQTSQGNVIPGLRKREDNSCIFYFPPNCSIYTNRPMACRNYPLAFVKKKNEISCVWGKKSL